MTELLQKPEFNNNKNRVVMWSGGLDSTYLLYYVCLYNPPARMVKTISVSDHPQLSEKMLSEQKAARERFIEYVEEKFNLNIWNIEIDVDTEAEITNGGNS